MKFCLKLVNGVVKCRRGSSDFGKFIEVTIFEITMCDRINLLNDKSSYHIKLLRVRIQ